MRLSEKKLSDIAIGDKVTSAIGNPGTIAQIILEGQTDVFGRQPDGCARLLILWSSRNWSFVDHEMADEIEMDDVPRSHYAVGQGPDAAWIVIDGSGSLVGGRSWDAIRRDIDQHWSNDMQVRIVTSTDGATTEVAWSGTVRELDDGANLGGASEALGASITELVPPEATAIVYTDCDVVDRGALFAALAGRPHQIIVVRPDDAPPAVIPAELRLRRRDVRHAV